MNIYFSREFPGVPYAAFVSTLSQAEANNAAFSFYRHLVALPL
jgi:hypothetical protein